MSTQEPISDGIHAADFALKVYEESYQHLAGPMPIQEFLDTFLPTIASEAREESDLPPGTGREALSGQIQQEAVDPFVSRTNIILNPRRLFTIDFHGGKAEVEDSASCQIKLIR